MLGHVYRQGPEEAERDPYPMAHRGLNARFKYGKVTIVWNKALSEAYAARMAEE